MGFCRSTSAVAPDDPSLEPVASKASSKGKRGFRKKGSGRLEGPPAPEAAPSRDGLHSAPSGDAPAVKQDPVKVDRAGLHSAPAVRAVQPAVPTEEALPNPKQLGDFLLESADGGLSWRELHACEWRRLTKGRCSPAVKAQGLGKDPRGPD